MLITPDQCLAEAANMALELRLKDRALAAYEQQIEVLQARIAELEGEHGDHAHDDDAQVPGTGHTPPEADGAEADSIPAQTPS